MSDTTNPLVEAAIEAIADVLYRFEYGATRGLQAEKEWATASGLEWPTVTIANIYTKALAAFYALHGIVCVVTIAATDGMVNAMHDALAGDDTIGFVIDAANAAGDLTKGDV